MQQSEARTRINKLGKSRRPFVFLIDFEMNNIEVFPESSIPEDVYFDLPTFSNHSPFSKDHPLSLDFDPIDFDIYKKAFEFVQAEIKFGNSFLTNLTFRTPVKFQGDLMEIYRSSVAKYKLLWKDRFVVFSPESFVKIKDNQISSYPMKGTIDAGIPNAAEIILNDKKEEAEHYTIVDLIRNDLNRVARNVRVEKFRYLDFISSTLRDLLQVSSKIVGDLEDNFHDTLGDLLFKLLPAGSISGAPKKKTIDIIQFAEQIPRGYYTGVAGYYDGHSLDSFVMIRFIEQKGKDYFYRSGGGLTFMSQLQSEFQELQHKIYVPSA
ncbi:MAG: aminodeoxychorismate synthase component I [Saprospiraceae bacterium]|nr:aminodeoxychorismate synthase component I [Saprospiraceae bacterium]